MRNSRLIIDGQARQRFSPDRVAKVGYQSITRVGRVKSQALEADQVFV